MFVKYCNNIIIIVIVIIDILWVNVILWALSDTMQITVWYVPVPIMGMAFAGTGMVWKILTCSIPVTNAIQKEEYINIDMIKAIVDLLKVVGVVLVDVSSVVSLLMKSEVCDLLTSSTSAPIILHPLDAPIKGVGILVAFTNEKVTEELVQVRIVRFVIESEHTSVVEEDTKFIGETAEKDISGGGHLLLCNVIILLHIGSSFESLPWEGTTEEVH